MLICKYVYTLMGLRRFAPFLLLLALAAPARAEDDSAEKAQARLLLSQGNAYFERGDLRAALVNFRAAYTAYPSPTLLVNAAAAAAGRGGGGAAAGAGAGLDGDWAGDPQVAQQGAGDRLRRRRRGGADRRGPGRGALLLGRQSAGAGAQGSARHLSLLRFQVAAGATA